MDRIEKLVAEMRQNPTNTRYSDLVKVCNYYFGEPRQRRSSHLIYKTPWAGNPRVNIQQGKNGQAKVYQVRQILESIEKLEEMSDETDENQS